MICLVKIDQAEGYTPAEKECGCPPRGRSTVKRQLSHLYRSLTSRSLSTLSRLPGFFFLYLTYSGNLGVHTPLSQDGFEVKAPGRSKTCYGLVLFPDF